MLLLLNLFSCAINGYIVGSLQGLRSSRKKIRVYLSGTRNMHTPSGGDQSDQLKDDWTSAICPCRFVSAYSSTPTVQVSQ